MPTSMVHARHVGGGPAFPRLLLHRITPLILITCAAISSTSPQICLGNAQQGSVPNIVLILADDLGWTDLGCQGSEYYETPHIDSLAADGMRLLRYYNCQNCAPTRAALMSGQHGVRTGIYTVGSGERGRAEDRRLRPPPNRTQLPLETVTLAQALGQAGYATGMFGKWHLGHDGDYKLMEFFEDGRLELYNLREDPGEREDLASRQPQRAATLHRQLIDWRERMAAPMPLALAD